MGGPRPQARRSVEVVWSIPEPFHQLYCCGPGLRRVEVASATQAGRSAVRRWRFQDAPVRWLRSHKTPSARKHGLGLDNVCPGHRITLSANRKTGYEWTTIGNQLRTFNRTPTGVWTTSPDHPGAVVVYADATGGGSRLGLEAGTICRHRTGLYALARHESNQPLIRMPLPDGASRPLCRRSNSSRTGQVLRSWPPRCSKEPCAATECRPSRGPLTKAVLLTHSIRVHWRPFAVDVNSYKVPQEGHDS